MEIISGIERRRQWRIEDKLRIVAEAERRGARFAEVARRHEVSRSVLWAWRKQARSGALVSGRAPVFMPVQILRSSQGWHWHHNQARPILRHRARLRLALMRSGSKFPCQTGR
jgi:transposase-like protein